MDRIWALRHRPGAYWFAAAVLTLVTVVAVIDLFGAARRAKAAYGETVSVAVARRDLAPGAVVTKADVEARALPRALVPDGAQPVDAVIGRTVRWPVLHDEAVLDARLAIAGRHEAGALLPPGTVGVAVAAGRASPPLEVGAAVALVAPADVGAGAGALPGIVLGTVIALDAEGATVAVPEATAPALAQALARGELLVALRNP